MDLGEILSFANSGIGQIITFGVCFAGMWLIDNKWNKSGALQIAYNIADKVEDNTKEGTTLDNFLDQFTKAFEMYTGRKPSAGELKTAADVKKKVEADIKKQ